MTKLSPAAAAVLQAFSDTYENVGGLHECWPEECVAAVLQALAERIKGADDIRRGVIDIAIELEAQ